MDVDRKGTLGPRLPKSLWQYVASFLPLSAIQSSQLYTVNRAFLEYYLKHKYHTTLLDFDDRLGLSVSRHHHGQTFSLPIFAGALKTLKLNVTENIAMTNVFTDFIRLISARLGCNSKRHPPAVFQRLPKSLTLMKNLMAIEHTITSRNIVPILDFNKLFPLGLSNAWKASRNSLTRLSLTLNMVFIPKLELSDILFPNLKEFSFCFDPDGCVGKPRFKKLKRSIQADLIPFIHRHRKIIIVLSMSFRPGSYDLGQHFLSNLPTFPSLRDLALNMKLSRKVGTSGLHTVLYVHSKLIERLELQLGMEDSNCEFSPAHGRSGCQCSAQWWKSQPFMYVVFPRLGNLRCHFERQDDHELLFEYLARIASRVKVLDLRPRTRNHAPIRLHYEHVDALSLIFNQHGGLNQLERLYLECRDLAPKMLKLLATGLLHLKFLYISFRQVALLESELPLLGTLHRDPVLRAYRVFAGAPCLHWNLKTLVLEDQVQLHPSHKPALCKAAMRMALPNLKSLRYLRHGTPLPD